MSFQPGTDVNETVLDELAAEPFLFVANPGNAGDAAIAHATYAAFRRHGCNYAVVHKDCDPSATRGKVLVYAGGGNLVPMYDDARDFIARHHRDAKKLVLLPHTVEGHADLLASLGPNVHLVCRELGSYDHVRAHATNARVSLAHDMAFTLDAQGLLNGPDTPSFLRLARADSPRTVWRRAKWLARHALATRARTDELFAFRRDVEATAIARPRTNLDLSVVFTSDHHDTSPPAALLATYQMLRFLDRFRVVHTNRLHVCVLSALLGKTVHFHANSYRKNRDVYMHSLKDRFDRVVWHD
jgi:exopolysaccharide biosynthesis predicted pyruvyltransferase EpsI